MSSAIRLYGCNGKPRPASNATYMAQSGWLPLRDDSGRAGRIPVLVDIKASFGSTSCKYDASTTDRYCAGCCHAAQPVAAGAPP